MKQPQGVAAAAANDVWAVGTSTTAGTAQTLILHWDGATWTTVSSPNGPGLDNALYGVAAIATSDVWAVGNYTEVDAANPDPALGWQCLELRFQRQRPRCE